MHMRRMLVGLWMVGSLGVAASAHAHFYLDQPPSWKTQTSLGDPQKAPPCGDDNAGRPTGVVTPFRAGETITITLRETIPHPGHFRVALSVNNRSELPPEPPVTAGTTPCGSTVIQNPPVYPVLADGALPHTSALVGSQQIRVKLPDNVTCTKCTLQIIQWMSQHDLNVPGGCFYHHCADISISSATGTGGTGGSGGTGTGGAGSGGASGRGTGGTTGSASGGVAGSGGVGGSGSGGVSGSGSGGVGGVGGGSGGVGGSGSGGVSGSGSGGVSGSGGAGANASGGVAGSGTGAANAAGLSTDESGCTCSVPGRPREALGFGAAIAVLFGLAWRRRGR
jgi:hypothetical protein